MHRTAPLLSLLRLLPLLSLLWVSAATAATMATLTASDVNTAGGEFSVSFDGNVGGTPVPGLTATADFALTSWSYDAGSDRTTVGFDILLSNTSSDPIDASGVTALGFNVDPDLVGANSTAGFPTVVYRPDKDPSFPNGYGDIDICFKNGQDNNCNGSQGGPNQGESLALSVELIFAGDVSQITLENFGVRYQRIDSDSLQFEGESGTGHGNGSSPPVPEPSAALVFGLGAVISGIAARRRQR